MSLITDHQVVLELDTTSREDATRALAQTLVDEGRVTDIDGFLADVRRREEQLATALPGGLAIPHARSPHVTAPSLAFGRSRAGIDWGGFDGPADLIFLIAVPEEGPTDQLAILARLARRLTRGQFRETLRGATDRSIVAAFLESEVARP